MATTSTRQLPSDVSQIMTVARYDLFKHLRSRRLQGILVIVVLLLALMLAIPPLVGQPYYDDPTEFVRSVAVFFLTNLLIILGATLFAGDAIVSEYQARTGYLLFPNPIKRSSIYLGKFLATALIVLLIVSLWYGVAILAGLAVTGGISGLALQSYGLAMLYALAAASLGYLIGTFMKGSTGALVLTFFLLLLILPTVDQTVGMIAGIRPEPSLSFQSGVVDYVFMTPYPEDSTMVIDIGEGQNFTFYNLVPKIDLAIVVFLSYMLVCNAVAMWRFKRREMLG